MSRLVESGGYLLLSWNATELEETNCQAVRKNLDAALKEIVDIGECKWVLNVSVPNYLEEMPCETSWCVLSAARCCVMNCNSFFKKLGTSRINEKI